MSRDSTTRSSCASSGAAFSWKSSEGRGAVFKRMVRSCGRVERVRCHTEFSARGLAGLNNGERTGRVPSMRLLPLVGRPENSWDFVRRGWTSRLPSRAAQTLPPEIERRDRTRKCCSFRASRASRVAPDSGKAPETREKTRPRLLPVEIGQPAWRWGESGANRSRPLDAAIAPRRPPREPAGFRETGLD